jgi:hypothetical protein
MNNDRRSTDLSSTSSDDDGEKSAARKDTRNMDSCTVNCKDCDTYSTVENDPEDKNGRCADGCTTATDDGACVIRDSGGWITVEKKRRSKDRMLTSNS